MESDSDQTANKLKLIEEVQKRPVLWNFNSGGLVDRKKQFKMWNEIAQILEIDANTCKQLWKSLQAKFRKEMLCRIPRRIAKAKRKGLYDPNKKYYNCPFYDALRFLKSRNPPKEKLDQKTVENNNSDPTNSDLPGSSSLQTESDNDIEMIESDKLDQTSLLKLKVIEEVRKRPALWSSKIGTTLHTRKRLWNGVGEIVGVDANTCQQIWAHLRAQLRNEKKYRIPRRIAKAKQEGSYDPNKKYHYWFFYDALKFIENRYPSKEKADQSTVENSNSDQTGLDFLGSSSLQTESDTAIEMRTEAEKLQLIKEVQKRPLLWDSKLGIHINKRELLWNEVAQIVGVNAKTCRQTWRKLYTQLHTEMHRYIPARIAKAKKEGSYDPNKKYYRWPYVNHLRFLVDGSNVDQNETNSVNSNPLITKSYAQKTAFNLKLIEEVGKRPALWDAEVGVVLDERNKQWNEIAEILDVDANACKENFTKLRSRYWYETRRCIPSRIAKAKEAGSYDPNKKYSCWVLLDALRFLEKFHTQKEKLEQKPVENNNSNKTGLDCPGGSTLQTETENGIEMSTTVDKWRLIEEVKKRPMLWELKPARLRPPIKLAELWREVGQILGVNAKTCRQVWRSLRSNFQHERVHYIPRRIAKAKKEGSYDPNKKYYYWIFYDALRFLADGLKDGKNFDRKLRGLKRKSASFNTENNIAIDTVKSEQDDEFTDHYNLGQNSSLHDNCFDNDFFVKKSDEYVRNSDQSIALKIDAFVKQEPELQIEAEKYLLESKYIYENSTSTVGSTDSELTDLEVSADYVKSEHRNPLTSPDLNDEDYSFLCSFLRQTKSMTPLQKTEFHLEMQKLLAKTFPAGASANILEKQLLLPEDHDLDKKLLISFWPYIKSMSLLQNLQFRLKITDLLLQTLCPETNQQL